MKKVTLRVEELSDLCLELSSLLHAGVNEADALSLLAEGEENTPVKQMLSAAAQRMDDGASLSAALREEGAFPVYLCGLLEVGEHSGRTEEALAALATYYEQRQTMERRVRNALLSPAVMLVLMLAVIAVLLIKVLPMFDDVYATLGSRLTGVAGGLLALGQGLKVIMPVLCVLLGAVVLFLLAISLHEGLRKKTAAVFQRGLGDRGLFRKMNNAKITQAMAMAMRSGLTAEEALGLAVKLVEDTPAASARCIGCRTRMEEGAAITESLRESGIFSAAQGRLFQISERSGTGDAAMERIARTMAENTQAELEEAVGKVEPALVTMCSVLVGMILLSVMLPLMNIMTAIG